MCGDMGAAGSCPSAPPVGTGSFRVSVGVDWVSRSFHGYKTFVLMGPRVKT